MLGGRREFSALRFAWGLPPRWSSEKCLVQVTRAASNVVSAVNRLHVDQLSPVQGSLAQADNLKKSPPASRAVLYSAKHLLPWPCVCLVYLCTIHLIDVATAK